MRLPQQLKQITKENMNTPTRQLTVDDAMARFRALLREEVGDDPADNTPTRSMTPEEREASLFRIAEVLLSLACPDPKACSHPQCRRNAVCRHFARVRAKRGAGTASHPRRTPGAEAARYAVWVFMSPAR
jgi:hypothetical protein